MREDDATVRAERPSPPARQLEGRVGRADWATGDLGEPIGAREPAGGRE